MTKINLKSDIKKACDILRRDDGTSSVNDYMEQISWLLFLKIFEGLEKQQEEIYIVRGEEYEPIIEEKYRWSNWATKDWIGKPKECLKEFVDNVDNIIKVIGEQDKAVIHFIDNVLFPYLTSLSGTSEKEKVASIFSEISGNKVRSPYNLMDVIDKLKGIEPENYEDTHVLSQFYEELLLNMGNEAGWGGEFYTPRPVVEFICKVVNPEVGDSILDPFAGSGGFLIEAYKYIKNQLGDTITTQDNKTLQTKTFYGYEKKPLPYLVGVMNVILHGLQNPNFFRKNTLQEDVHDVSNENRFSVIMTNPPFGGEENKNVQSNFPFQVQPTEALALQYCMRKLKLDGKCGIILPEGKLLFGMGTFKQIRKELISNYNVNTIISLPRGVFTCMGTGIKSCIIFFDKSKKTSEIFYYELEGKFTKRNPIQLEHFQEALDLIEKKEITKKSWIVSINDLIEKDYDLTAQNPNRVEEGYEKSPLKLLNESSEINNEIKIELQRLTNLEKEFIEFKNSVNFKEEEFGSVCDLLRGPFGSSVKKSVCVAKGKNTYKLYEQGNVIENNFKIRNYYLTEEKFEELKKFEVQYGDILFTCAGTIGRVAIVPEDAEKGIINSVLMRVRVNTEKADINYMKLLLESPNIQYLMFGDSKGGAIKNLKRTALLKSIKIPLIVNEKGYDIESQKELAKLQNKIIAKMNNINDLMLKQKSKNHSFNIANLYGAFEVK